MPASRRGKQLARSRLNHRHRRWGGARDALPDRLKPVGPGLRRLDQASLGEGRSAAGKGTAVGDSPPQRGGVRAGGQEDRQTGDGTHRQGSAGTRRGRGGTISSIPIGLLGPYAMRHIPERIRKEAGKPPRWFQALFGAPVKLFQKKLKTFPLYEKVLHSIVRLSWLVASQGPLSTRPTRAGGPVVEGLTFYSPKPAMASAAGMLRMLVRASLRSPWVLRPIISRSLYTSRTNSAVSRM